MVDVNGPWGKTTIPKHSNEGSLSVDRMLQDTECLESKLPQCKFTLEFVQ